MALHVLVPLAVAFLFYRQRWLKATTIMLLTMLVLAWELMLK